MSKKKDAKTARKAAQAESEKTIAALVVEVAALRTRTAALEERKSSNGVVVPAHLNA